MDFDGFLMDLEVRMLKGQKMAEGLSEQYDPPEPPRLYEVQESKELMDSDGFLYEVQESKELMDFDDSMKSKNPKTL